MSEEHRRHPRRALHVEFRGKDSSGAGQLLFAGADLSSGGAFLTSDLLLELGETCALEFRVPGVPRLMRTQARVAWVRRFPKGNEAPGMGMEFLVMSDEDQSALERYLASVRT